MDALPPVPPRADPVPPTDAAVPHAPEAVPPWAVRGGNRLVASARPALEIEGLPFVLGFGPPAPVPGPRARLSGSVGRERWSLVLPWRPLEALAEAIEPVAAGSRPDGERALLVALAAAGPLDALQAALGLRCTLDAVAPDDAPDDAPGAGPARLDVARIGVAGTCRGEAFAGSLELGPEGLAALAGHLPPAAAPAVPGVPLPPVVLSWRLGATRLGAGALRGLVPGDAVLVQDRLGEDRIALFAGERHAAPARLSGGGVALLAAPAPVRGGRLEGWSMTQFETADAPPLAGGGLSDIDVQLVFELGRARLGLGELAALRPGHVFDLGRDLSGPVEVLANGRRIGHGEVVRIGAALGVRLLGLAPGG